jgi:hypothetical protein
LRHVRLRSARCGKQFLLPGFERTNAPLGRGEIAAGITRIGDRQR